MHFSSPTPLLKGVCTSPWRVWPEQLQVEWLFCEKSPSANWELLSFTDDLCEFFPVCGYCDFTAMETAWVSVSLASA